ncbi:cache domain-containing protein [Mesorhizobium comanense]|uniref:cache domain-containing protein n=1 Tax=Mesorhizobium comanense TaxID=2502215 RepID=UPI0010F6161E|nr:cache domain-containing protein [Mesorhizobium comanense]
MALSLAVALPILAFAGLLLLQLQFDQQAALERRTVRDAQGLATATERQLQDMTTTLRLLSTAPELQAGDLGLFHARSQLALRGSPYFIILVQDDGQQLLNTRVDFGSQGGKISDLTTLGLAMANKQLTVSGVFYGKTSQTWVFNVVMPLPFEVTGQGSALIMTQNAAAMASLVGTDGMPEGWSSALVDNAGSVIAQAGAARLHPGDIVPAKESVDKTGDSPLVESDGQIMARVPVRGTGWKAMVWGPVATAQASIFKSWRVLLAGGLALFLLHWFGIADRPATAVSNPECRRHGGAPGARRNRLAG